MSDFTLGLTICLNSHYIDAMSAMNLRPLNPHRFLIRQPMTFVVGDGAKSFRHTVHSSSCIGAHILLLAITPDSLSTFGDLTSNIYQTDGATVVRRTQHLVRPSDHGRQEDIRTVVPHVDGRVRKDTPSHSTMPHRDRAKPLR